MIYAQDKKPDFMISLFVSLQGVNLVNFTMFHFLLFWSVLGIMRWSPMRPKSILSFPKQGQLRLSTRGSHFISGLTFALTQAESFVSPPWDLNMKSHIFETLTTLDLSQEAEKHPNALPSSSAVSKIIQNWSCPPEVTFSFRIIASHMFVLLQSRPL